MQVPLEITFRGMDRSEAVDIEIRKHVDSLEIACDRITSCHVTLELPHRHKTHGKQFEVRIIIAVPGRDLVVSHRPGKDETHTDAHLAIRHAFRAMRRELEDYVRKIRGDVKAHEPLPHAKVSELFPLGDYGFIKTFEGLRLYFHRNAVVDGRFDELDIDSEVSFREELGDKGPQASTVRLAGRHHHAAR